MQVSKSNVFNWVPKITKAKGNIMQMDNGIAVQVGVKQVTVFAWLWFVVVTDKEMNRSLIIRK